MEKASGKVGIVRVVSDSRGEVILRWADLSRSSWIKAASLREATADEKAAFEQQHQACAALAHAIPLAVYPDRIACVCACVFRWPAIVTST